jgi:non-ribosomal peptide synthetase component E (peptide arylation enzyme)
MGEGLIMVTPWDAPTEMRRTTVGTPIHPLDEVRIVDDELAEVPHGQLGELTTRGPYTIAGYYNAESHNANVITPDGFFRTGDLARAHQVDGQVFYSIEGRIKDNIDRGGEKINAEEIEWQLSAYPAVASVAVVGMPDPEMGERLCAYIVARPGFPQPDVATIGAYLLKQGFAKFKLPERIEIIDAMPLTAIGKISKKTLREEIAAKLQPTATQPSAQ